MDSLSIACDKERKEWLEDLRLSIQEAFKVKDEKSMEKTRTASVHERDENEEHLKDATKWALEQKKSLK